MIQSPADDVYDKPKKGPIAENPYDKVVLDTKCVFDNPANIYDEIPAGEEKPDLKGPIVVAGYTNNEYVKMP